jgi:hypothetical protein
MHNEMCAARASSVNRCLPLVGAVMLSVLCAVAAQALTPCDSQTVNGFGKSYDPIRIDSNHIKTYGASWTTGDTGGYWTPYSESWQQLNGSNITSGATASATPNTTATSTWTTVLNSNGPGAYRDYSNHRFVPSSVCSNYGTLTIGNTTGAALTIARPTRPDYQSGQPSLTFLGLGTPSDGAYYTQTVLTLGAANGATDTPVYVITAGSTKLSLSCTNCSTPTATATGASSACDYYDVLVNASYGGFLSDPMFIYIKAPRITVTANDADEDVWNWPRSWGNGWKSSINYTTTDTCGYTLSAYHMNESFGSWTPADYSDASWNPPTPKPWNVPATQWADELSFQCPAGDCNPMPANPPTGCWPTCGTVKIQHALQTFKVGSETSGVGIAVQQNTHQRYQDHGAHEVIVTPVN